ncbi:hypothetical protein I2483_09290 [Sporosarcina sp. E16_3]|uniref:hypothetical protein n=1 Tax=Sporosarcina sp. E16_3 TaxID=2789293 RepID=UPI001A90D810|nr:hypothetical protein [Sporosarcina sp. E16_3]MBO0601854.1 hypothetical protein [Sporosarcina sp. E16_3]
MITIQNETKEKVVGNLLEANVTLYAIEREGYLEKFRLEANGGIQYFPYWINVSNEAYWPQLFYKDIIQDGKKELIIVLTRGYGTGVIEQFVHVLHNTETNFGEVYGEILVDNPMAILLKNVKTKLTKSEAIINIGNERTVIQLDKLGIDPKRLFSDVVTGSLVRFDVLDNELTAIMGAQTSPLGGYIGEFHITYEFKDQMYQVKRIKFIPLETS